MTLQSPRGYYDDGRRVRNTNNDRTPLLPSFNNHGETKSSSYLSTIGTVVSAALLFTGLVRLGFMIPSLLPTPAPTVDPVAVEIAIIGAGPAGIAAADKLWRLAHQKHVPVNLTLFEQSHALGGRLVIAQNSNLIYPWNDTAQSPIEPEDIASPSLLFSNKILLNYATSASVRPDIRETHVGLGIFDGKKVSFETTCPSSASSWGSWLGQIFKYGASIWRAIKLPTGTMAKLHRLSSLESHSGFPFATVESMIAALRVSDETEMSGEERNRKNGISESYQNEVMTPETYCRLGQDVAEINDLALSMALQDVDQSHSHSGGSIRGFLADIAGRSGAHLRLDTRVIGLHYELISESEKSWIVKSRKEDSGELEFSSFQKIILATPWDPALLDIEEEFDLPLQVAGYRSRHVTLFTSRTGLDSSFFGHPRGAKVPEQILPRITPNMSPELLSGIHEIAWVRDVTRVIDNQATTELLFRILSTREVVDSDLYSLVDGEQDSITWVHRAFIPQAYPLLYARKSFPPMALSTSFWHTSAAETFTSSLDGAMFAGANTAALVIQQLEREKLKG